MTVEIDPVSGFCNGVVRAIHMAEKELQGGMPLFSLGDIVHNELEVTRLQGCGMRTINYSDFKNLRNTNVLIRAHGEPPETYSIAAVNNINLVDATCPVVLNLQKKIHMAYIEAKVNNGQIVIYGKSGHAEVNGLVGQTDNTAIVVDSEDEINNIDFSRPVYLFSQTTMTLSGLEQIRAAIEKKQPEMFCAFDTICRQVSNREPHLLEFASRYDAVIFVSGRKSSNGKALFEICLKANPHSRMINSPDNIDAKWFEGVTSVGVCGATSTPRWLMETIADRIRKCPSL